MKMQASVEFLLAASTISVLIVIMVSSYSQTIHSNQSKFNNFSSFNASTYGPQIIYPQNMEVRVFVPQSAVLDNPNIMRLVAYGCNGSIRLNFISKSVLFSQDSLNSTLSGIEVFDIYFTPLNMGYNQISVNSTTTCNNIRRTINTTYSTYGTKQGIQLQTNQLTATILNRNESYVYPLLDAGNIIQMQVFSHCTYANGWGPTRQQCGSGGEWSVSVFSDVCYQTSSYYTETYCFIPVDSGYQDLSAGQAGASLHYNFTLKLASENFTIRSNISNNKSSRLTLNNLDVGNASVENASGIAQQINQNFLDGPKGVSPVNSSNYQAYLSDKNSLYSQLSAYNGSEVSPDIASALESMGFSYINTVNKLLNSSGILGKGCTFNIENYTCYSQYPFSYIINASFNGLSIENMTLQYLGSYINVKGA
ncbi:MAG: hypothetical protein KGH59_00825 [Candidatus Micrarchaeota archaeon]|nr:hypothetical protein [Candidatus Micrarchaeota archaeon]